MEFYRHKDGGGDPLVIIYRHDLHKIIHRELAKEFGIKWPESMKHTLLINRMMFEIAEQKINP